VDQISLLGARTVDWPHVHILVNHFPIILAVMGTLAVLLAVVRGQRGIWLYGTISLTLAALTVIPAYFTGAPAEHALNRPWYVPRGVIHSHEDAAKISALLVLLAGLVSLLAWRRLVRYPREMKMPGVLRTGLVVTSLAASIAIGYASWLGGRIVHDAPVLQGPAPAGYVTPGGTTPVPAQPPGTTAPIVAPAAAPGADTTKLTGTPATPVRPQP
jgi:uncharacterized membrane protein